MEFWEAKSVRFFYVQLSFEKVTSGKIKGGENLELKKIINKKTFMQLNRCLVYLITENKKEVLNSEIN